MNILTRLRELDSVSLGYGEHAPGEGNCAVEARNRYLADANLAGANLAGAEGTLQLGPVDAWMMTAVRWEDGPRIHVGCRWFTVAEAREHWGPGCADRRQHGDRMLAGVDALVSLAKAHGWET